MDTIANIFGLKSEHINWLSESQTVNLQTPKKLLAKSILPTQLYERHQRKVPQVESKLFPLIKFGPLLMNNTKHDHDPQHRFI